MVRHLLKFFYTFFCIVERSYLIPLQFSSLIHKYLADSLQNVVALVDDEENFVKIDIESDASHKVFEEAEEVHICRLTDGGAARRNVEDDCYAQKIRQSLEGISLRLTKYTCAATL